MGAPPFAPCVFTWGSGMLGHAKKPNPRWLVPGEVIDIEIEGIGICSNPIVDEEDHTNMAAAE